MGRGPGWNRDGFIQAAATGATNLAMLPALLKAWRLGLYYEMVIGFMTMATSAAYHTCESLNYEFLGFNEGRWHHMDNVFAILSFMAIFSQFSPHHREPRVRETANAVSTSVAVVAQLMSPWQVEYTVAPIVAALVYVMLSIAVARKAPRVDGSAGLRALLTFFCAVTCFVKGLDEAHDTLRLWHGGWHLSVGAFSFYVLDASHPPEEKVHPQ
mmetsp:Transcript_98792/g.279271  ORF Transcript_98792/g.279271 Transcript_98792/m.279271 type:complete len:213 (+) Transcript_98792:98-736(+)